MRLPTQILLLGAILTNSARASETEPGAASATPTPAATPVRADAANPGAGAASPDPAADNTTPVQLERVLVTADLWATPAEEIAASVSVYGGETLAAGGVRHFGDLAGQIPNLTFTGGSSRPRYFQIRGIGENSQFEGETPDSSVRFLVDDLDFTGLGAVGSTFDVRQAEVLRGPQAGAFGANAAGGVIRLVTREPTPEWTGYVEGSAGEDNLREVGLAAGGPLVKNDPRKLMFRLAVQRHESDGFRRNAFLDRDTNARDELSTRLKITWNPGAAWRWDATVFFADVDNGYDEFALDNNGRFTFSDQPGRDTQESLAGSLRGVYSGFTDTTFTTVTSATGTDSRYSYDADWTAWRDVAPINTTDGYSGFEDIARQRDTFGQELRLDSVPEQGGVAWIHRWTLGAYFSLADEATRYVSDYAEAGYAEQTRLDAGYRAENAALFGQLAHDLDARNRVIAGLRVEDVRQEGGIRGTTTDSFGGTAGNAFAPDYQASLFGGKVTFEHDLAASRLLYASVARGYRGGGINLDRRIVPGTDPLGFETETLWSYEAGLRSRWLENRLFGGLAVFYTDRSNTQFRNAVGAGNNYRFFTDNGGDAAIYGLEAEVEYHLAEDLVAYGSAALMHSSFETFRYSSPGTLPEQGGRLPNTPDHGFTVGLRYQPAKGAFGRLELVTRDSYLESLGHDEERSASEVVNASVGYSWARWRVTLWARNLLDEGYEKRVFRFANTPAAWNAGVDSRYTSEADPRQVGVTAGYGF